MAKLNIMYQDMWPGNLEQAKTVRQIPPFSYSFLYPIGNSLTHAFWLYQIIMEVFESFKEERVIANKLRQEFEKAFGKLPPFLHYFAATFLLFH